MLFIPRDEEKRLKQTPKQTSKLQALWPTPGESTEKLGSFARRAEDC